MRDQELELEGEFESEYQAEPFLGCGQCFLCAFSVRNITHQNRHAGFAAGMHS